MRRERGLLRSMSLAPLLAPLLASSLAPSLASLLVTSFLVASMLACNSRPPAVAPADPQAAPSSAPASGHPAKSEKEPNLPPPAGVSKPAAPPVAKEMADEAGMIDVNTAGGTRGGGYALFVHAVSGGKAVASATVAAYDDQKEIAAAKTDKDGYARLLLPAAGSYRLIVTERGQRRELMTAFKPGGPDVEVDLSAKE